MDELREKTMKAFIICLLFLTTSFVFAHEAKQNSAQVYLRDGQVEVRLFVNRDEWVSRLSTAQSWLLGDSDIVLTQEDIQSSDLNNKLLSLLEKNIILKLNKQRLQLKAVHHIHDTSSHHRVEFRLSAAHSFSDPKAVTLSFPRSIGAVFVSVVKPQYGTIKAGEEYTLYL